MKGENTASIPKLKQDKFDDDPVAVNDNSCVNLISSNEGQILCKNKFQSRSDHLIFPRLLSRKVAAEYCGISPNSFTKMVADKTFPSPIKLGKRLLWDIRELNRSIDLLGGQTESPDSIMEQINAIH